MKDPRTRIYEYTSYIQYLAEVLAISGASRGMRSRLAAHLRCQTAFISQVLHGQAHFSLEHALGVAEFLSLDAHESHFFMLLVHKGRAGSKALASYYEEQIEEIREQRRLVRARIQVKQTLSIEDQATYYSAWYYAAIHVMLSIPALQSKGALADYLRLPVALVSRCVDFLVSTGLAVDAGGGGFKIGNARIHIGNDATLISRHHANWRTRTLVSLDQIAKEDLHYSSVVTLADVDAEKIRGMLLDAIERSEPILKESKEEGVFVMAMDFFRLRP